jgi:hypothetical protein
MFSKQTKNIKVIQLFRCKRLDKTLKSTKMAPNDIRIDVMCKQRIQKIENLIYLIQ